VLCLLQTVRKLSTIKCQGAGPHTMLCCTRHLSAVRAVWSALSTQCAINLEQSNALSTQCTRSNGHSALSATHLTGTECSVRASCVVPCAREPRRPPWASLSLSLPLTRALPRLDLPVSVLACDVRKPIETFGRELEYRKVYYKTTTNRGKR